VSVELQRVKRRIGTTRQIQKVTGAMQRVASARLVNDRRNMEASGRYTLRLRQLMEELFCEVPDLDHPLLRPGGGAGPVALIVFGAERGLCGGFNAALMTAVSSFVAAQSGRRVELLAVGKIVARRGRRQGFTVAEAFPQPGRNEEAPLIDRLTELVTGAFTRGDVHEVHVLYARFVSGLTQEPVTERVLPVPLDRGAEAQVSAAIFEPDAASLLRRLIRAFVRQIVDHAYLNSVACENAARQVAMNRATENAGEMLRSLMGSYRRLRQETITSEMLDIIGGRKREDA